MADQLNIRVGDAIIYHPPGSRGIQKALVTKVFSGTCINLIFVPFTGATQKDGYGVKPVPVTQVMHESVVEKGLGSWWKPGIATKMEQTELDDTGKAETQEPTGDDEMERPEPAAEQTDLDGTGKAETREPTGDDEEAVSESEPPEPGQQ